MRGCCALIFWSADRFHELVLAGYWVRSLAVFVVFRRVLIEKNNNNSK